jgi:hypothetical protein
MSPTHAETSSVLASPPRASGDEPRIDEFATDVEESAPRERG